MTYGPGSRYAGTWLNSKKHGNGTFYFRNGDCFEGQWFEGRMHGKGTYSFIGGDTFCGTYINGEKEHGNYLFNSGAQYTGNWRDDLFDGKGTITYPNGECYFGSWLLGMRHCRDSRYSWPSGSRFWGTFEHDQIRKGLYRSTLDMGDYQGSFVDGRRCGLGFASFQDGSAYYGTFYHDHMDGIGTYKFQCVVFHFQFCSSSHSSHMCGSIYEGAYSRDKREVPCTYSGFHFVYVGLVRSHSTGVGHGWGRLIDPNGDLVYSGMFCDGEPSCALPLSS